MDDLISRQAAIDAIEEYADRLQMVDWKENPAVPHKAHALNWCINTIRDLPAAQPQTSMLTVECKLDDEELAKAIEEVKKANLELIAAEPHWIPVTERLPEESDDYLCSYGALTGHFVGIDIYDADKKEFGFYSDDEQGNEVWHHVKNVVAWMPIPKPWKGEQDES